MRKENEKLVIALMPLLFLVACVNSESTPLSTLPEIRYPNTPEVRAPTTKVKVEENATFDFGDILKFFADLLTK